MNSSLYECQVMHARFSPGPHRFLYRIFLFAIDLDELGELSRRLPFFSVDRRNLYSFRDRDYLPTDEPRFGSRALPATPGLALKRRVLDYLASQGVDLEGGRVLLITLPRVFGYGFNPVSFYFCLDRTGTPVASIAEVTNTFREVKPYFLGPATFASAAQPEGSVPPSPHRRFGGEFRLRVPKFFYVSPYSDVDVAFDFTLRVPGEKLSIQIDDYEGSKRTLTSTLTGRQHALSGWRLAWFTLKYPLLTLRMIGLIHWHAFLLWVKRIPWFAKSARPADQRDLYRPHASIAPSDSIRSASPAPVLPIVFRLSDPADTQSAGGPDHSGFSDNAETFLQPSDPA